MSAQHTPGGHCNACEGFCLRPDTELADDALIFSVWRETNVMPRRKLAAFRNEVDAQAFAEHRARIEGGNDADIDTTIWAVSYRDGVQRLLKTYPAATGSAS